MTRIITIVCRDGDDFDVHEGERYTTRLCWGEMIEQVVGLTHGAIAKPRYPLRSPEETAYINEHMARLRVSPLIEISHPEVP